MAAIPTARLCSPYSPGDSHRDRRSAGEKIDQTSLNSKTFLGGQGNGFGLELEQGANLSDFNSAWWKAHWLVLEFSNQLSLGENVSLDGALQFSLCCPRSKARLGIERIELEEIAMR
jgi:hypothetical protein